MPAFASVVLDVDSTVSGAEGIEWLAGKRGPKVANEIARLTQQATDGEITLESVYAYRLKLIEPSAAEVIGEMRENGIRIVLVSGGIRQAILPLGLRLGFTAAEVFAVRLAFDEEGHYSGFDDVSPLTTSVGKARVVQRLYLPRPLLVVGDGITDLAALPAAD